MFKIRFFGELLKDIIRPIGSKGVSSNLVKYCFEMQGNSSINWEV